MSADIIAWLRSAEGEAWSRARAIRSSFFTGRAPSPYKDPGPVNAAEDPTGRPPTKGPAQIAATGTGDAA